MTAKEKADEIIKDLWRTDARFLLGSGKEDYSYAKKQAVLSVQLAIEAIKGLLLITQPQVNYWKEVILEINMHD